MSKINPNNIPIPVIMGPTASGKSSLALSLAKKLSGEIISADSMQVYRGLNIGTAKPTAAEMKQVPHHLIDILDIGEPLDIFKFIELADKSINEIRERGNLPIVVGGSGLYIRSLIYGLNKLPADPNIRKQLDEKYDSPQGFIDLKKLMSVKDPVDFQRWKQHRRKLIRALEIFEITGKSITELQTLNHPKLRFPVKSWTLCWERDVLKERIRNRAKQMLNEGWIEETKLLIDRGIFDSPTAQQAIGYRLITAFLKGDLTRLELETKLATKTWQYARRQITWFEHKHPEAEKINMPIDVDSLIAQLN